MTGRVGKQLWLAGRKDSDLCTGSCTICREEQRPLSPPLDVTASWAHRPALRGVSRWFRAGLTRTLGAMLYTQRLRTLWNYSWKAAGVWRGERAKTHTNYNWAKCFNFNHFPIRKICKRRESFTEGLVDQTPRGTDFWGGSNEWWESPDVNLDPLGTAWRQMTPWDVRIVVFVKIKSAVRFLFTQTGYLKGKINRKCKYSRTAS